MFLGVEMKETLWPFWAKNLESSRYGKGSKNLESSRYGKGSKNLESSRYGIMGP